MKSWAYVFKVGRVHELDVFVIKGIKGAGSKPSGYPESMRGEQLLITREFSSEHDELMEVIRGAEDGTYISGSFKPNGWKECRPDVEDTWHWVDGVFMSAAAYRRFESLGPSAIPRNPRVQEFCVFNFMGMDNFFLCKIKVDIDNYTPADVRRLIVAYYDGKIDIGITSNAGDPDGVKRYYRSIDRMVYTNILSLADINEGIKIGGRHKYAQLLHPAVSLADYIAKRMPETNKVPLQDDSKLFSEYALDPAFPIIAHWSLDPAPRWNVDLADIGSEFLEELVIEIINELV
ncbi:hypothetical protein [Pseudomonas lactis]|uniref:hypothetical protein n=1 Tax=Pseudomonas lactis TaxID=1615674 RepID=UPI0006480497|nr:hypothetical protein [Pseudomonas lactis]